MRPPSADKARSRQRRVTCSKWARFYFQYADDLAADALRPDDTSAQATKKSKNVLGSKGYGTKG